MTHYFIAYDYYDDTDNIPITHALFEVGAGDDLTVTEHGSIFEVGAGNDAIYVNGYATEANITIAGMVYGTYDGIYSLGQYANFLITGSVTGGSVGMSIANSAFVYIAQGGLVSGGTEGIAMQDSEVVNDGTIHGSSNDAVQLASGILVNNGLLSAPSDAIFWGGDGNARVTNTGTIQGDMFTWYGATEFTATMTVENSGNWYGGISANTAGNQEITNTGRITDGVSTGNGSDTIDSHNGFIGGDINAGGGADLVRAGAEDNVIIGGAGGDTLYGGGGNNTLSYGTSVKGVRVDLATGVASHGDAAGDHFFQFQNVYGTLARDVLNGDNGDNQLYGILGNDRIFGNGGNDSFTQYGTGTESLYGGDGNDFFSLLTLSVPVYGRAFGADTTIDGGTGFDTVELGFGDGAPIVFTAKTLTNVERMTFQDNAWYDLTSSNATVAAGQTLDVDGSSLTTDVHTLYFNGSAETNGKFTFEGGGGGDRFTGGAGADVFEGGGQGDIEIGGGGADTFVYSEVGDSYGLYFDWVKDFTAGTDHWQFDSAVTAVDPTQSGTASIGNLASRVHTMCQGVLHAHEAVLLNINGGTLNGHTFMVVDANGTGGYQDGADYLIDVTGISGVLTTADFLVG